MRDIQVGDKVRLLPEAFFVFDGEPDKIVEVQGVANDGVYVESKFSDGTSAGGGGWYRYEEIELVDEVPTEITETVEKSCQAPEPLVAHVVFRHIEAMDPGSLETVVSLPVAIPNAGAPLRLQLTPDSDQVGRVFLNVGNSWTVVFLKDLNKAINKLNA